MHLYELYLHSHLSVKVIDREPVLVALGSKACVHVWVSSGKHLEQSQCLHADAQSCCWKITSGWHWVWGFDT